MALIPCYECEKEISDLALHCVHCGAPKAELEDGPAQFYLAANGVTAMCPDADVGQTGEVNGIVYTKRSRSQIDALVAAKDYASLTTTCTSGVTDMNGMCADADAFNQDISSWNVSSVTTMQSMFYDADAFNQDLSGWCVSNIASKPPRFDSEATSWVMPRPAWGTCP